MATKLEITNNQLDDLKDYILKLPKATITLEKAIYELAPIILDKVENDGYSIELLADIITNKKGIVVSASTLKSYLNKYKKSLSKNQESKPIETSNSTINYSSDEATLISSKG